MAKYMLARGQKANAYQGFRREDRNGREIVHNIEVPFVPNRVVDTDVELDHWVKDGVLVSIREGNKQKTPAPAPAKPAPEVIAPPVEEPEGDYEELEDGTFKCLHCEVEGIEKILKTEAGMQKHVQSAH